MKKVFAILLAAMMVFSLAACDKQEVDTQQQPDLGSGITSNDLNGGGGGTAVQPTGATTYENSTYGIRFQYPESWMEVSAELVNSDPQMMQTVQDLLGMDEAAVNEALQGSVMYAYNLDAFSSMFSANISLSCTPANGLTEESLVSSAMLSQFQSQVEYQYQLMLEEFAWEQVPVARQHGNYTGVYFSFTGSLYGIPLCAVQYALVHGNYMYTFTYMTDASVGLPDAELNGIFSSVEFF